MYQLSLLNLKYSLDFGGREARKRYVYLFWLYLISIVYEAQFSQFLRILTFQICHKALDHLWHLPPDPDRLIPSAHAGQEH